MANHPIREAWNTGAHPGIAHAEEQYTAYAVTALSEITGKVLDRTKLVLWQAGPLLHILRYDATNTDAPDDLNVIHDTDDNPFVRIATLTAGASGNLFDAYAALADRGDYDAEAEGFTFFATDDEEWYVRVTATPGTWAGPFLFRGPAGNIEITGTSTTSLALGTGNKVFTTQEGIAWPNGTRVRAASAANPATHWMEGVVTAYAGTSLTLAVDKVGAGLGDTRADWNLFIAGEPSSVAGADGTDPGLLLNFETGTSAPPSAGAVRANNADLSAATKLYVSKVNRAGSSIAAVLAKLFDAARTRKDSAALTNPADDKQATVQIDGLTDQTGYVEFNISGHDGETAFAAGAISLSPVIAAGDDGADGAGTGDVSAAANIADNAIVRGDGGAKGVQSSGASIDDSGFLTAPRLATSGAQQTGLAVVFNDDAAGVGPIVDIERVSASAAANDSLGRINFSGRNNAGSPEKVDFANLTAQIVSETDGAEEGQVYIQVMVGGSLTTIATVKSTGIQIGSDLALKGGVREYWIPASFMRPKAANGAAFVDYDSGGNDQTIRALAFDASTQEYAHFGIRMPKSWNESTVTFKPVWTNAAGLTTENVVFSLAGRAVGNDDAIDGTFGTAQTSDDGWLAQNDLHEGPESSAITIGNSPAEGDFVNFEVSRVVGSDNLTGDALLFGIVLRVGINAANDA